MSDSKKRRLDLDNLADQEIALKWFFESDSDEDFQISDEEDNVYEFSESDEDEDTSLATQSHYVAKSGLMLLCFVSVIGHIDCFRISENENEADEDNLQVNDHICNTEQSGESSEESDDDISLFTWSQYKWCSKQDHRITWDCQRFKEESNLERCHDKTIASGILQKKVDFRDPKKKKKNVWAEIREVFEGRGYEVSYDDLDRKFRNLKHHYKTIIDNKKKTGRGRMHWEYFEPMQEIFVGDDTVHAPPTISSSIGNTTAPPLFSNENTSNTTAPPLFNDDQNIIAEAVKTVNKVETPSTAFQTSKKRDIAAKAKGSKALYLQRKAIIDMERERITILDRIAKQLELNNEIQKKRNLLLEEYITNMHKK
ncbi:hypothetical protein RN001_006593 [Aquatica leii]|uniref:Myb/SANT-like DNA-binding domain-containing protein n=1 Tax=Aquatica leii TaxID=1421715 RepID=A0AAN7SJX2_9COLE|nr:hypothetical protein RN001_006593 [Aquatica leii]